MFKKSCFWYGIVGFCIVLFSLFLCCVSCRNVDENLSLVAKKGNGQTVNPGEVLSYAQQEAVLELVRRDHEIGNLRQAQRRFQDLHLELLRLRFTCLSSAPPQICTMIDSVLISARIVMDSNVVLTDGLNPMAELPEYALAVESVRKQQLGLIRDYGFILVAFIRNGCDGRPLREKFGLIL